MRSSGPIPGQPRFGVDRAIHLRGDEVKPSDMRSGDKYSIAKFGRSQTVGVDVDEQLSAALTALGERAHLHHLPGRSDRDIAICAVVRSGDDLSLKERTDLAQAGHRCAGGEHGSASVDDDPHLAVARGDGWLIHKSKQPAVVPARLRRRVFGRCHDVGDDVERQAPVRAERDRDLVLGLEQVGQEQIPELVERQARIAAGVAEAVVVADQAMRPGGAAVEADGREHSRGQSCLPVSDVAHHDDVVGVGRVDGDRLFGLVEVPLASVNVVRDACCARRADRSGSEHPDDHQGAECMQPAHGVLLPT